VAALRRGEIQVLDRLAPWQVKSLRADADVTVQSYALPRLHCLVANLRKPLTANRTFRRGLAYGIDRRAVLEQITRGETLPGCVLLHGPLPVKTSAQDPLGNASDPEVKPWPYDPRLALALAEGGRRESASLPSPAGRGAGGEGTLVLAYPPDDIARTACMAIRQQLAAADIAVELKELTTATGQVPADVDLLYVELAMWEPLVDAPRVLGENGLAGACSA
jgi:ABC-type transport system substrate-binding protein